MSDIIAKIAGTYDEVPYLSSAFGASCPEHLQAIGRVFNVPGADPAKARVLELGCSMGGNIIPFATRWPKAEVIGLDLSSTQVKKGQKIIQHLGLRNIELRQMNMMDVDKSLGKFDYIICHGVYSWVPPEVQRAIMRICSENLVPTGLAYISYNTYPGWKGKEILRDAMLLRSAQCTTPQERLAYGRGMIEFMQKNVRQGSALAVALAEYAGTILKGSPHYILHEYLEDYNAPCYFKDFMALADEQGLGYVAESNSSRMVVSHYGQEVEKALLAELGNQIEIEQYMDFIADSPFRMTILAHKKHMAGVQYNVNHDHFAGCHIAAEHCASNVTGGEIDVAIHKKLIDRLMTAWPATLSVDGLIEELSGEFKDHTPDSIARMLRQSLRLLFMHGQLRVRCQPVAVAPIDTARPVAFEALRDLLAISSDSDQLPVQPYNAWHEAISFDIVAKLLIPRLDGTRDREALYDILVKDVEEGRLSFLQDGAVVTEPEKIRGHVRSHVDSILTGLRKRALLV